MKAWLERYISSEVMALALMLWLCCLVIIGLTIVPLFGVKAAAVAAVVSLVALLIICWRICICRLPAQNKE